ncbi:MAG: FprA family A-type flavoprotein [Thermoplasmata archaeon]|nr:FprA family A-type flavoprotein [Thermoplasmata archaeon]
MHEIKPGIYWVGAEDWDRRLFDSLIPLPEGTSYNAYLVVGSEKTALLDTVDPPKREVLIRHLDRLEEKGIEGIDYIVSHHTEQDHSGAIPDVLERYPGAKVVASPKAGKMLVEHLRIPESVITTVDDGDTISLGDRTLEFIMAPWVHWPETMFTYIPEDRMLFTCDFLGSHLATGDLYDADPRAHYLGAKRYYAEIMMPFAHVIPGYLERIRKMDVDIIAPSHGLIHRDPDMILSAYEEWTSDKVANMVLIPYVSMHGSTRRLVEHLAEALMERDIPFKVHDLTTIDLGEYAMDLVDAATVILGTPTVLGGPHPLAVYAAYLTGALRPKTRYLGLIGSYGWGGRMPEAITDLLKGLKAEMLEPVIVKGHPTQDDLARIERLADEIAGRHRSLE